MLLFFTGIRGCDISCMELSDIDWEKEEICIIQQKTANGLTLPMSVAVGNAIYDYVTMERPSSEEAYVFLCMIRPYRPPQSLDCYLSADMQHLREYALSIETFPVSGEVIPL